jgi:type IV secretory pathway TraG/TraD family ATPase VirD4
VSKDKTNDAASEIVPIIVGGIVLVALMKLIITIVFIFLITAGATLSLAYREKELYWARAKWATVFFEKLKFALMLVPFVLIAAIFAEYYMPTKIKFNAKNLFSSDKAPSQEDSKAEQIKKLQGQIAKLKSDSMRKTNEVQEGIVEFQELQNKERDILDTYEKDRVHDEIEAKREQLLKKNGQVEKNLANLPRLQKRLQSMKAELSVESEIIPDSNYEIVKIVTTYLEERNKNDRVTLFTKFALILLSGAFILSFILTSFIKDEDLDKNMGLSNVARVSFYLFRFVSWISYIFIWPFVLGKFLFFKKKKKGKLKALALDVMQLGHERNAYLTDNNLNYHTQIIGGSGAGKTNLLKVMLEDRMAKGHSIIFFDFKADIELMDWMAGAAEHYQRKDDLMVISMSEPKMSYAYNPIKYGSETEISSQIMNAFTWSESFYQNKAEGALLIILKALCYQRDIGGRDFHLGELYQFLNDPSYRMDIVSSVSQLNYPEMFRADLKRVCEELSTNKKDNYQSLITQISKILNSSAGEIVATKIGNDDEFEFKSAMSSGKIAYLFMNSLKLKDTAAIMGKLMLQDLMKTVGNIYDDRNSVKTPTTLIIDEFASFATPDFGEFIEKARGAGIGIVVAYQSRKSLDHIEENLALKINENTANKIAFQVQDSEDVEWFCSLLGTRKTQKETYQAEEGIFWDNKTGQKSVREVEEYVVHPNEIKKLGLGQAFLYCSKVDPHHVIMNIKKANEFNGRYERISAFVQDKKKEERQSLFSEEKEIGSNDYI